MLIITRLKPQLAPFIYHLVWMQDSQFFRVLPIIGDQCTELRIKNLTKNILSQPIFLLRIFYPSPSSY